MNFLISTIAGALVTMAILTAIDNSGYQRGYDAAKQALESQRCYGQE